MSFQLQSEMPTVVSATRSSFGFIFGMTTNVSPVVAPMQSRKATPPRRAPDCGYGGTSDPRSNERHHSGQDVRGISCQAPPSELGLLPLTAIVGFAGRPRHICVDMTFKGIFGFIRIDEHPSINILGWLRRIFTHSGPIIGAASEGISHSKKRSFCLSRFRLRCRRLRLRLDD